MLKEHAEIRIISLYIENWFYGQIIYRILIFSIIYLALLILLGAKNFVIKASLLIVSFFVISDTFIFFFTKNDYPALFIHPQHHVLSLVIIATLIITQIIYLKNKASKKLNTWVYGVLIIPTIAISFIRVVYLDDWLSTASNTKTISIEQANNIIADSHNYENILMPFFSTSCGFCKIAAIKIGVSNKNGTLPPTCVVLPSNKEKAKKFILETKLTDVKYVTIPTDTFTKYAGFEMPCVFYIDNTGSTQWIGEEFNNLILSNLAKIK